jgi:hypothetical protein
MGLRRRQGLGPGPSEFGTQLLSQAVGGSTVVLRPTAQHRGLLVGRCASGTKFQHVCRLLVQRHPPQ